MTDGAPPIEPERVEVEIPPVTAPEFSWEIHLNVAGYYFQRLLGGGMQLKFCPIIAAPGGGAAPSMPGIAIRFPDADAWAEFKRRVGMDGEIPIIQTVREFGGMNGKQ